MSKANDPERQIALIALQATPGFPGDMLIEVIEYAFDQLCYRRSGPELLELLAKLNAVITE